VLTGDRLMPAVDISRINERRAEWVKEAQWVFAEACLWIYLCSAHLLITHTIINMNVLPALR
jgi:hypothetical protein